MRQGQQNRRGRGRGNRKNQNPLTRSFESNGPDVKIRGTPSHIAEKYMSYARDALASSDPVLAENYLQHAEHYNRIIMTYREQQMQQNGDGQNYGRQPQPNVNPAEGAEAGSEETSAEAATADTPAKENSSSKEETSEAAGASEQPSRPPRSNGRQRRSRSNANGEGSGPSRGRRRQQPQQQAEGFGSEADQPDFVRRAPVRRSRRVDAGGGEQPAVEGASTDDAGAE